MVPHATTAPAVPRGSIAGPFDHAAAPGEFYWGGIAGTQWFIHPGLNLAGVLMLQRVMGFSHPVGSDFKRAVYQAVTPAV